MNSCKFIGSGAILLGLAMPGLAATVTIGTSDTFGKGLAPLFGTLINFDDQTPLSTLSAAAYSSEGVSSITNGDASEPLLVLPYSDQSPPNYISTGASDNYAGNITFTFANLTNNVGLGISEDGVTPVTLTAFGAGNNVLGSFTETVPSTTFNAYYVISDTTFDIKSVSVSAAQNLAIDDVQLAGVPEPRSLALSAAGLALLLLAMKQRGKTAA